MAIRIYGNRKIETLAGEATRPTASKVREALFNIWQGRVLGARCLDLCSGSGAIGAEALCRGASEVVGIEKSGAACKVVLRNWQKVAKPEQTYRAIRGDVVRQLKGLTSFDLIYFDPPYASGLYQPVLNRLANCLTLKGEVAVEYGDGHWDPHQLAESALNRLEIVREKHYGSTSLVFFQRQ
ncbi:MAG: 16S rRNA (guanine(966)-N(2))-methyltransferase RsmD [Cyanobacteria bacterium J06634_6]